MKIKQTKQRKTFYEATYLFYGLKFAHERTALLSLTPTAERKEKVGPQRDFSAAPMLCRDALMHAAVAINDNDSGTICWWSLF